MTKTTKVIPYFAPAENTQVIVMEPEDSLLRIYEHEIRKNKDGNNNVIMKRIKKIFIEDMADKIDVESCHVGVATDEDDILILIDNQDMHIIDLRNLKVNKDVGGYIVDNLVTHKGVNIHGL